MQIIAHVRHEHLIIYLSLWQTKYEITILSVLLLQSVTNAHNFAGAKRPVQYYVYVSADD